MKADFEKGTKICCRCKKELPLDMFYKNKSRSDLLSCCCKKCNYQIAKKYQKSDKTKRRQKRYGDKTRNTFGRVGNKRGCSGMIKRDYELTKEQLNRRNISRKRLGVTSKNNYGVLIWYSGKLEELSANEYKRAMNKEYNAQRRCAIRGYIAKVNPSEHFIFDFDLEQMLKGNVYICGGGNKRLYITKWWKGEMRHWTVKDGIWKE